jgi:myosin heavy subunit
MTDIGTVAVIDPVKRDRDEMEVYSAKKPRPDFTYSDREEIKQLLGTASTTLYEPQRAIIVRTSQDIARFRKDLDAVNKKDVTKEKYREKIADLEALIRDREAEHDEALWEIQQDVLQAKQRAQIQLSSIAHQAQQQVAAVSHQAQQQVAAASHQAQFQQAQLVHEGTMIIRDKERKIDELQRSANVEIQALQHDKSVLERQVAYASTTNEQMKQQNAAETQRLNNIIADLNKTVQDTQVQSQRRLDELSQQMMALSSTHSATVGSTMEEKRLHQQTLIEKETLVNNLQTQLFDLQQKANANLTLFNDESIRHQTDLNEARHRLQQADARNAQLKIQHDTELAQLQHASTQQQTEVQRLQAQLQAASLLHPTAAVHNVHAARTPQAEPVQPIVKGLTELVSHQHKLGIPYFSGYLHEPSIEEWLKEAERVARTAGWDNEMKIRFFGDRLRHMALALHEDLLSKWVKPNFNQWKSAMLERFQDKSAQDWNCSNKRLHNELWILEVKSTRSTRRLTAQVPL